MHALSCKSCGAAMRGDGFDRRLGVVVCAHCGAIFDLTRRADREAVLPELPVAPAGKAAGGARAPVALPAGMVVDRQGPGRLAVRWRWFQWPALFLLFFAVAWDSFLVFWYGIVFTMPDVPWIMAVFPLVHVAVGVAITYTAVAKLLNRTTVDCDGMALRVRHGPLPWWPQPTVPVAALEQLYVERKVKRGKNGTTVSWNLLAVTRDHSGLPLVTGLDDLDQALWLEQELEDGLGIRDRPVAGEYTGAGAVRT